jgi:hypothetical protein
MCPICITTVALIVASATSAGGLATLVAQRRGGKPTCVSLPAGRRKTATGNGYFDQGAWRQSPNIMPESKS